MLFFSFLQTSLSFVTMSMIQSQASFKIPSKKRKESVVGFIVCLVVFFFVVVVGWLVGWCCFVLWTGLLVDKTVSVKHIRNFESTKTLVQRLRFAHQSVEKSCVAGLCCFVSSSFFHPSLPFQPLTRDKTEKKDREERTEILDKVRGQDGANTFKYPLKCPQNSNVTLTELSAADKIMPLLEHESNHSCCGQSEVAPYPTQD